MMKMYIANCTDQRVIFQYRLPEDPKLHEIEIGMRSQESLPHHNLSEDLIHKIAEDHAIYGCITESDARNSRGIVRLVYAIDKYVNRDLIMNKADENRIISEARSEGEMKAALAAADHNLRKISNDHMQIKSTEIIEQADPTDRGKKMHKGVRIAGR